LRVAQRSANNRERSIKSLELAELGEFRGASSFRSFTLFGFERSQPTTQAIIVYDLFVDMWLRGSD
jgi:hypothetical protein